MTDRISPYAGLFVVDASQGVAGPNVGMWLAALGADVVKVEPPEGDWSRGLSARAGGHSAMSTVCNRGKRSVVLDLRAEQGRADLARLLARAEVVIESFRPGVAARLGIVPEAARPDAVFLSISGFGQAGPYAERPCTDSIAQAFSGLAGLNQGGDGVPHKIGVLVPDMATGLYAIIAVQAALAMRARDAAPRRRVLDVSLMAGTAALMAMPIAEWGFLGGAPPALNTPAGSYRAACGSFVMITLVKEAEFVALCEALGLGELPADPRYASFAARAAHRDTLLPLVAAAVATRPAEAWIAALQARRLLAERINTPTDYLADPHVRSVAAAPMMRQPGLGALPMPVLPGIGVWDAPAPGCGADTAEVLC